MKRKPLKILCILLASLVGLCVLFFLAAGIADLATERYARVLPSYEKQDISSLLAKESWTEEDYRFLYLQTGAGKEPLDELKNSPERIYDLQRSLFYDAEWEHEKMLALSYREHMTTFLAPIVPLKEGDILLSSSVHTLGWRNGHAALYLGGNVVIEASSPGAKSALSTQSWFRNCPNFLVLRPKIDKQTLHEICAYAKENLVGIDYSLFVGFFSPKDQEEVTKTHCSHLVWQAFMRYGYDLDSNGGNLVTAKDIAYSPLLEVVQVFGFDPISLWNYT